MTRPYYLIFVISIPLIFSCTKAENYFRLSSFETPIIEGYNLRNLFGDYVGSVGNPNVKNGDYDSEYFFRFYPNPAIENCYLYTKSPTTLSLKKLWITMAQFGDRITNYSNNIGMNNFYIGGVPLIQIEFNGDNIQIDLSSLEEGYYRIYIKIDENILYDNLVIINSNQ